MKNLKQVIAKSNEAKAVLSKAGVVLADNILVKTFGCSMELITCTDSTLAERVFGGGVDVTGHIDFGTKNREIKINVGSMGAFDPSCKASMSKITMQHAIVNNWEKFATIVTLLMKEEHKNNQGDVCLPETYADMINELQAMFDGDLEKALSHDAKILFKDNFTGLFNY